MYVYQALSIKIAIEMNIRHLSHLSIVMDNRCFRYTEDLFDSMVTQTNSHGKRLNMSGHITRTYLIRDYRNLTHS